MKKMITLITIGFLYCSSLLAPVNHMISIEQKEGIKPFTKLIYAIGKEECSFDTLAYNREEKATGYFQIRPIRIDDYNKRTGSHYALNDMYDYHTAEKVFLYYASNIGPYNFEKIAKNWNGSGEMTIDYWKRVRRWL
jgi:hypothetical protein